MRRQPPRPGRPVIRYTTPTVTKTPSFALWLAYQQAGRGPISEFALFALDEPTFPKNARSLGAYENWLDYIKAKGRLGDLRAAWAAFEAERKES